jgi:transcriptional regulator with XRE-family HTH domain
MNEIAAQSASRHLPILGTYIPIMFIARSGSSVNISFMETFGDRIRERAAQLGLSIREMAMRCGLEPRRFAHYASGDRDPDLQTLVAVARKLDTSPNWLLGFDSGEFPKRRADLMQRLAQAAQTMSIEHLRVAVIQAEAVARDDDSPL